MPFKLTNSPASFQGWMKQVFKPLVRRCVLVFFHNKKTLTEHWHHLEQVFKLMRQNKMYIKESKCSFAKSKVEYLRHFISGTRVGTGVETDPKKIEAASDWPTLTSVKELRCFLGLTGYYRKFVQNYAKSFVSCMIYLRVLLLL